MPTVIKIGYQEFIVKRADAVPVESRYRREHEYYFPAVRRQGEISMRTIPAEFLLAADPGEADVELQPNGSAARAHGDRAPVRLLKSPQRMLGY